MDLGQSRRGVDMGPSALRGVGLQSSLKKLGLQVEDIGNLSVKQQEEMPVGEKRAKVFTGNCRDLRRYRRGRRKIPDRRFFSRFVLGGDHSIAAGVAAGLWEGAGTHFFFWHLGGRKTPSKLQTGQVAGALSLTAAAGFYGICSRNPPRLARLKRTCKTKHRHVQLQSTLQPSLGTLCKGAEITRP